jgi:nitroimidazol reductase NimA-like FMN-containing flavoprotein (pyridoxamine 5'-phosphate oxidase superfamily)
VRHASRTDAATPGARHPGKMHVEVRDLSRDESLALLAGHHIGRVGISFHDLLRVELAAYLYSGGWIYARTELGDDVVTVRHHPWAAFEVDEVMGIYDWRTVEAWGSVEFLSSDVHTRDWFQFENAVRLMRGVVPQILTADDPMPQRVQLVRMHVDSVRGRESHGGMTGDLPAP